MRGSKSGVEKDKSVTQIVRRKNGNRNLIGIQRFGVIFRMRDRDLEYLWYPRINGSDLSCDSLHWESGT